MKRRKHDRRAYDRKPDFPFLTGRGVVLKERRSLRERRVRDINPARFRA